MAENKSQTPEVTQAGDNTPAPQPQAPAKKASKKEDRRGTAVKMHGVKMFVKG